MKAKHILPIELTLLCFISLLVGCAADLSGVPEDGDKEVLPDGQVLAIVEGAHVPFDPSRVVQDENCLLELSVEQSGPLPVGRYTVLEAPESPTHCPTARRILVNSWVRSRIRIRADALSADVPEGIEADLVLDYDVAGWSEIEPAPLRETLSGTVVDVRRIDAGVARSGRLRTCLTASRLEANRGALDAGTYVLIERQNDIVDYGERITCDWASASQHEAEREITIDRLRRLLDSQVEDMLDHEPKPGVRYFEVTRHF